MRKIIQPRKELTSVSVTNIPLLDRIYRARNVTSEQQLDYSFTHLLNPSGLTGIDDALGILVNALQKQTKIIIIGDFDVDGATSTAVAIRSLKMLGFNHIDYLIPNRFEQGYGLSIELAQLAVEKQAELVITVDNGITCIDGIEHLLQHKIQTIITDHHLVGDNLPNADAIINPNLANCNFLSKNLAGVGVIFYLMLALRSKLRELDFFTPTTQPNLTKLIDLVALGTVADVVPLDHNNRILVAQGLQRIRNANCCPGITALLNTANRELSNLNAMDLAFSIAPRLNAAGRLEHMALGVELLLTDDMQQAQLLATELHDLNQTRKDIELSMREEAMLICDQLTKSEDEFPKGIVLYHPNWHQGILGIIAARLKDQYYRPVIAFSQDKDNILKGSARSIHGLHIRDLLADIHRNEPNLLLTFGGHAMAAGLSLYAEQLDKFKQLFNQTVEKSLNNVELQHILFTDGELTTSEFSLATVDLLAKAGPWGQAFPEPLFNGNFQILEQRIVGTNHLKLKLKPLTLHPDLHNNNQIYDAIMFGVDLAKYPNPELKYATLVYRLNKNEFRGKISLQLYVEYIEVYNPTAI